MLPVRAGPIVILAGVAPVQVAKCLQLPVGSPITRHNDDGVRQTEFGGEVVRQGVPLLRLGPQESGQFTLKIDGRLVEQL